VDLITHETTGDVAHVGATTRRGLALIARRLCA